MCVMRHDNTCNKYTSLLKQMHKFTQVNKHNRLAYENCMLTKLESTIHVHVVFAFYTCKQDGHDAGEL